MLRKGALEKDSFGRKTMRSDLDKFRAGGACRISKRDAHEAVVLLGGDPRREVWAYQW